MNRDEIEKQMKLDAVMVELMDEFEPGRFEKLVYQLKALAGAKAAIPLAALGERKPPTVAEIARAACLNLLRDRISEELPEPDPYSRIAASWLDPYFDEPPLLKIGEIDRTARDEDFSQLAFYLSGRDLGTCKYSLRLIKRRGIQHPRLVVPLIDCLRLPVITYHPAELLLPYRDPRAVPGLIWAFKYYPIADHLSASTRTLAAIGQPAVEPIAVAYHIVHALYERLQSKGARWRSRIHELGSGAPLFPAVQRLADGMGLLQSALSSVADARAVPQLRELTGDPIPWLRQAAQTALAASERL